MAAIDVDALLEEITPDAPCGEDISYDADFLELERLAEGTAETQVGEHIQEAEEPDWKQVRTISLALLERSRDIRVILYLMAALLRREGLSGYCQGMALLRGTVERWWDHFYPQLDPEDDNDPLERMNILSALSPPASMMSDQDPMKFIPRLTDAPLCEPSDARLPHASLRDILVASGELTVPENSDGHPPTAQLIDAAFDQTDIELLRSTERLIDECLDHLNALDSQLVERVGADTAPNFNRLDHLLKQMQSKVSGYMARRGYAAPGASPEDGTPDAGEAAAPPTTDQAGTPTAAVGAGVLGAALSGQITSDQDVLKALEMITSYYERNEPSSPVPLLLRRAKRLVGKSFVDIIRDLSPDAISQVQMVSGEEESSEE